MVAYGHKRILAGSQLAALPEHRETGLLRQEIHVARKVGSYHRLAQQQRLGQRAAKTLGAMQRHIGIAGLDQPQHLAALHGLVQQHNAHIRRASFDKAPPHRILGIRVHGLEHQLHRPIFCCKSLAKRLHRGKRILARQVGVEVKHVKKQKLSRRQTELAARQGLHTRHTGR